jgi:hypothetical protein
MCSPNRDDTLILETDFETPNGAVTLIDFMPVGIACGVERTRTARVTTACKVELGNEGAVLLIASIASEPPCEVEI